MLDDFSFSSDIPDLKQFIEEKQRFLKIIYSIQGKDTKKNIQQHFLSCQLRIVILIGVPYQCYNEYIKCKRFHALEVFQQKNLYEIKGVKVANQYAGRCQKSKNANIKKQSIEIFTQFLSEKAQESILSENNQ
ncbi:hypothetical protein ABPG72_003954 [Tetrahymena utriculariae]